MQRWRHGLGILTMAMVTAMVLSACTGIPGGPPESGQAVSQAQPSASARGAEPAKPSAPAQAPTPAKPLTKVKISFSDPSYVFLPVFMGIQHGVFKKYGLDVEFLKLGPRPSVAALQSGDIQYTMTFGTTMAGIMQGAPVKLVAVIGENPNFYLAAHKSIPDLATLRKKLEAGEKVRMGTNNVGGTGDISIRGTLADVGFPQALIDKIQTVPLGDDAVCVAAMKQGTIELVSVSAPWPFQLKKEGWPVLLTPKEAKYGNPSSGLAVHRDYYPSHKAEIKDLIRGSIETIQLMKKDKAATVKAMMDWIGDPPDTADLSYEAVLDVISHDLGSTWDTLERTKEARRKQAEVKREVKVTELFDFELVWEIQKELGLPLRPVGPAPN